MMSDYERSTPPLKPVDHLILLLLAERPTYGVELLTRIDERTSGSVRLNAGSLYRLIARLVEDRLVETVEPGASTEGPGAPRKWYGVTSKGRRALTLEARRQAELVQLARSLHLLEEGP